MAGVIILFAGLVAAYFAIPNIVDLRLHFGNILSPLDAALISIFLILTLFYL